MHTNYTNIRIIGISLVLLVSGLIMKKKILIIEDEEILLNLLQKKLTNEGYDISIARDGEEGLLKMKEIKPNLILLDIIMPRLDGFGVLEKIIKDEELKKIPVIIISNSGQPVELERAKKIRSKRLVD